MKVLSVLIAVTTIVVAVNVHATETSVIDGEKVYESACAMCHKPGNAGAPKVGDTAAWEPRIAQGLDLLYERSIKGFRGSKGVMPPKGGRGSLSNEEVMAAVDYMVAQSGGDMAP